MSTRLLRRRHPGALLPRLIDSPDLVRIVRALPADSFSSLVEEVGLEDAGEIVALATTEQIVAAFDEDLFSNERPGERETLDPARFAVWLEILLEAGDEVAATRFTELSEDFVVHAVASLVLVLDGDALDARLRRGDDDARIADKVIEAALSEEIDGYLLLARRSEGWDSALSLILALDRDHHAFLVRVLDRCVGLAEDYVDDLDALVGVLTAEESLAEDVEAEREERRAARGWVESRAARSFLTLARSPLAAGAASVARDPITRAYFRDLAHRPLAAQGPGTRPPELPALLGRVARGPSRPHAALPSATAGGTDAEEMPLAAAMRLLGEQDPQRFGERMGEVAYLANVLVAGAETEHGRLRPVEAAEAALATVALGAEMEAARRVAETESPSRRATAEELADVLRDCAADLLFREASGTLAAGEGEVARRGFLRTREELDEAVERVRAARG